MRTIGLFANEEDSAVRAYRAKYAITYPLVRDQNGFLVANLQGSMSLETLFPAHIFIAGSGMLACYELGGRDPDTLENVVRLLVQTVASPLPPEPDPVRTARSVGM